jgi:hypothetical protein
MEEYRAWKNSPDTHKNEKMPQLIGAALAHHLKQFD